MSSRRVVLAGCGFLGEAAAVFFSRAGWKVLGICASKESTRRLEGREFSVASLDITNVRTPPAGWEEPELLIHCASSGRGGVDAYRSVYLQGMENLLGVFAPRRSLFTGSTSVYAQTEGEWVTEESATEPPRETGRVLLEAERVALSAGGTVARLAGIYGPGRSVLLRKFLEGTAVLEAGGHRWINQIHRDDGASALLALADAAPGIYNVCDDIPVTQRLVYQWIADFAKKPLPPEGPADLERKRGWTSKRVSNAKLRSTGWSPRYPSYRIALPGLFPQTDSTQAR